MKAYRVTDRTDPMYSTIVFAESNGKAKVLAQRTDACEDVEFVNISARRVPQLDDAYRGRWEMDWSDENDRIRMVRDAGYRCSYEVDLTEQECRECPAFEWCERGQRFVEDEA